jgi:hypothetical protein
MRVCSPPQARLPTTAGPEVVSPFSANTWHWILTCVVMIGSLFVGGAFFAKKMRVLQTKTAIKGLEIAMNGYDTEYDRVVGKTLGDKVGLTEGHDSLAEGDLLATLMSILPVHNPRRIRFYDPVRAKGQVNGVWFDAAGVIHLSDPWGSPYRVRADLNGDGLIPSPETPGGALSAQYIIYSAGPDKDPTTWRDNVASWK